MAESQVTKVEFTSMDKQWVLKSLMFQRAGLVRSRAKETPGSEIYVLRSKELQSIDQLLVKLA